MAADCRSGDDSEPCTLRFASLRPGLTASVRWVDYEGEEKEYARLEEWCFFNQDTFVNHPWRLRDITTGQLLFEYCGPTATISLLPDGTTRVQEGLHRPPPIEVTDPRWGTFHQRGTALSGEPHGGIPILAFDVVCQEAVEKAEEVIERMLGVSPPEVAAAMVQAGAEVAIIGKDQVTTDLPMYRHLRGVDCGNGGGDYDEATRGLGGNPGNPTTSCGEENLLMLDGDRYRYESILVHEFGHAVMDLGLHGHPLREAICEAYKAAPRRPERQRDNVGSSAEDGGGGATVGREASDSGRAALESDSPRGVVEDGTTTGEEWAGYDPACYMMANECEYWAEGSQAWFDATVREDVTSGVNSRENLKQRDPLLAAILEQVYGDGDWRYPASAPRPFPKEAARAKRRRTAAVGSASGDGDAGAAAGASGGGGSRGGNSSLQDLEHDNPLQPLLPNSGGLLSSSATARRGARRRGGSPAGVRSASGGGGSSKSRLASLPGRATRALARLLVCCVCLPL